MNKFLEGLAFGILTTLITFIFIGAILYSTLQISSQESIKGIFFWSALILIFMREVQRGLSIIFAKGRVSE